MLFRSQVRTLIQSRVDRAIARRPTISGFKLTRSVGGPATTLHLFGNGDMFSIDLVTCVRSLDLSNNRYPPRLIMLKLSSTDVYDSTLILIIGRILIWSLNHSTRQHHRAMKVCGEFLTLEKRKRNYVNLVQIKQEGN